MTRAILITGGAKRLGAQIARRFASGDWHVVLHANHSADDARALAASLKAAGAGADVVTGDLEDPSTPRALITSARSAAPGLCALVNSASLFSYDDPTAIDDALWMRMSRINALAPLRLAAELVAAIDGPARIVNVLDQKLANLNPDFFSYTASKAALAAASTMMAMSFGARARIVNVAPGLTLPSADQTQAEFEAVAAVNALQRVTRPSDVADTVYFAVNGPIASGQTLFADSGQHLVPLDRDVMFQTRQG